MCEEKINDELEEDINTSATDDCQTDGRPFPVNSKLLWAKISPGDHYRRLLRMNDFEAWQHLGDLIWVRLKGNPRTFKILQRGGGTVEDQVRSIMEHILRKIRMGGLHLDDPEKFYGLLKVIIVNYLRSILREHWIEDDVLSWDQIIAEQPSNMTSASANPEDVLLQQEIWQTVLSEASVQDARHRRAVELSLKMKLGVIDIKNNSELARQLSDELGASVSYAQAAAWIHSGMIQLRSYLNQKGFGIKNKKNDSTAS
ncbi:MAG: hypothetical protein J0665_14505 [Deltaproteobacteria bacterium]|nr:hypothetical protein [Deltaproteobacteria bacterium]